MHDVEYANESGYFHLDGSQWCGTVVDRGDSGLYGNIDSDEDDDDSAGGDDVGDGNNDISDDTVFGTWTWGRNTTGMCLSIQFTACYLVI